MFRPNNEHEQERLVSPVKDMPARVRKKLQTNWSTPFYDHFFTQIDEETFAVMYDDGYSRPNKPVNELVALEVIKHRRGLSDRELEAAYLFDLAVRNAVGRETCNTNINPNTFTNFRRRLVEFEDETGRNLMQEVFEDHRDYLIDEFDIDGTTQRMDSTFIDANIKQLSRIDLVANVVHNFLHDLPADGLEELPEDLQAFAAEANLNLSYRLQTSEVEARLHTLVEQAAWLVDRFEDDDAITELQRFEHLQRVLDEQCYAIPELKADEPPQPPDADDDDNESGWEPVRKSPARHSEPANDDDQHQEDDDGSSRETASDETEEQADDTQSAAAVQLKDPDDISSDSLQNPHDPDATFRRKNDESHQGYTANVAETCGCGEDALRVITDVQLATNNTPDTAFLETAVEGLATETGLRDLLSDGGFAGAETEQTCTDHGVTQHLSGIKGRQVETGPASLAAAEFDGHELVACPSGHTPSVQEYTEANDRYWGRMPKSVCAACPLREECFVEEKQEFYSYGFYGRKLEVARHRAKRNDPAMQEFLNLRAGAESMINELFHKTGTRTTFTGTEPVTTGVAATAIATNIDRVARFIAGPEDGDQAATSAG